VQQSNDLTKDGRQSLGSMQAFNKNQSR